MHDIKDKATGKHVLVVSLTGRKSDRKIYMAAKVLISVHRLGDCIQVQPK